MKKVYIAGKVTGLPEKEVAGKFANCYAVLRLVGVLPVNPIEVVNNPEAEWKAAMIVCISALMQCDAIFTLPCARNSKGALAEITLAKHLSIPVFDNLETLMQWNNSQPTP